MVIKALLVAGILVFGYVNVRGRPSARHLALRRGLAMTVLLFGVVAVIAPSVVTKVANLVGVGRGADLVLYVLAVSFLLVCAIFMQRISELERRYVELARRMAIEDAAKSYSSVEARDAAPESYGGS